MNAREELEGTRPLDTLDRDDDGSLSNAEATTI